MSFPAGVKLEREVWRFAQQVRSTGPSLNGQQQLIETPTASWRLDCILRIRNSAVREWRNWLAKHRGGLVPDLIGPRIFHAPSTQPYVEDGGFSDGTVFVDSYGFIVEAGTPVPITVHGDHAAGSTGVVLERITGSALTSEDWPVATYLGLGSRLYQVMGATALTGTTARVSIWPPLRAAASDGDGLDGAPVTKLRLEDPDAGWIPDRVPEGVSDVSLSFLEDLSSAEPMA